jgi:endo-1,4-beta-mannosidase
MPEPFVLGVNYWPRRKAMYWWSDFDAGEVDEEFAVIASIGMQIVRIFLLWDDWQPTPDTVSETCLNNLGVVCDLAQKHNLQLDVTFFTGHMSGPNWSPKWLLDKDAPPASPYIDYVRQIVSGGQVVDSLYRNPFSDPIALDAARLLLDTVVTRYKDHPAIWMWNLGNEPDLFAWPADAAAGRAWVREMTQLIKAIDSKHPVTCGLHSDSLHRNNGLRIDHVYPETDVAVMHSYPMYTPWAKGPLDTNFVPYTCALTTALCGKPTLMEEWGGCTAQKGESSYTWEWTAYGKPRTQFMASETEFAAYIEGVLPNLVQVGATGAMLWCYADYVPELWDKPPCGESRHERFFGLVRPDGTLKPHAEVIKRFSETKPMVQPAKHKVELDVTPDEYYVNPLNHIVRLYEKYLAQLD